MKTNTWVDTGIVDFSQRITEAEFTKSPTTRGGTAGILSGLRW
jgi:hypothetical protein